MDALAQWTLSVTQAAREGFEGAPSIATWVVGIGDLSALDAFAAAGGTGKALITDPTASQQLSAALNKVRSAALPCEFMLPDNDGAPVQPDRVNLRHTGADGVQTTIGAVKDRESCDPEQGGWYFDRPDVPTRIIACEPSCHRLNELSGEIKILLGCPASSSLRTDKPLVDKAQHQARHRPSTRCSWSSIRARREHDRARWKLTRSVVSPLIAQRARPCGWLRIRRLGSSWAFGRRSR